MKVIAQLLGYSFWILAIGLGLYLSLIALDFVHHLYGGWGYIVGILLLPISVPAATLYQGFTVAAWFNVIGLFVLLPLLWKVGSILIRWGRIP